MLQRPSAQRQHDPVIVAKSIERLSLIFAKNRFSFIAEDLGNGLPVRRFYHGIEIEEAPAEGFGKQRADGAFAGPHEASQDEAGEYSSAQPIRAGSSLRLCVLGHTTRAFIIRKRLVLAARRRVRGRDGVESFGNDPLPAG